MTFSVGFPESSVFEVIFIGNWRLTALAFSASQFSTFRHLHFGQQNIWYIYRTSGASFRRAGLGRCKGWVVGFNHMFWFLLWHHEADIFLRCHCLLNFLNNGSTLFKGLFFCQSSFVHKLLSRRLLWSEDGFGRSWGIMFRRWLFFPGLLLRSSIWTCLGYTRANTRPHVRLCSVTCTTNLMVTCFE